jgi:hypothetical protein
MRTDSDARTLYERCVANGNSPAACIDAGTTTAADAHAVALASIAQSQAVASMLPLLLFLVFAVVVRYWLNSMQAPRKALQSACLSSRHTAEESEVAP